MNHVKVGFLYLRYACDPKQIWSWVEKYIEDEEVVASSNFLFMNHERLSAPLILNSCSTSRPPFCTLHFIPPTESPPRVLDPVPIVPYSSALSSENPPLPPLITLIFVNGRSSSHLRTPTPSPWALSCVTSFSPRYGEAKGQPPSHDSSLSQTCPFFPSTSRVGVRHLENARLAA